MSNPFDFSDFGSARSPVGVRAGAPSAHGFDGLAAQPRRERALSNAFDPFGAAPSTQVQPRGTVAASAPASDDGLRVARPPLALLGLALVLATAGIVASAVWGRALPAAAIGWFAAGPMAIGVLSSYTRVDTSRRADAVYSAPGWTGVAYWVVVTLCLAGIGLGAWYLALWAGGQ